MRATIKLLSELTGAKSNEIMFTISQSSKFITILFYILGQTDSEPMHTHTNSTQVVSILICCRNLTTYKLISSVRAHIKNEINKKNSLCRGKVLFWLYHRQIVVIETHFDLISIIYLLVRMQNVCMSTFDCIACAMRIQHFCSFIAYLAISHTDDDTVASFAKHENVYLFWSIR